MSAGYFRFIPALKSEKNVSPAIVIEEKSETLILSIRSPYPSATSEAKKEMPPTINASTSAFTTATSKRRRKVRSVSTLLLELLDTLAIMSHWIAGAINEPLNLSIGYKYCPDLI